jgi:hypothetical protein
LVLGLTEAEFRNYPADPNADCSGDYKNVCRLVVNAEDKTLNIFFKMQ